MKVARAYKVYSGCVAGLLAVAAAAYLTSGGGPRVFDSIADFRSWAQSHGYHVWPETGEPGGVTVAESTAVRQGLAEERAAPRACTVQAQLATSDVSLPDGVESALWGRVVVFGPPELLAKLDALRQR